MHLPAALALFALCISINADAAPSADETWITETSSDGSEVQARSESGGVEVNGKLYALGGRGADLPVNVYDPDTLRWSSLGAAPQELHHFQPVAFGDEIYVIGALTGPFPDEPSVSSIRVLDTDTGLWSIAGEIPDDRLRGSTTAVLYEGEIYISGGNTKGHDGGAVPWFDKFNPETGDWTRLTDAPHARDHANAVVIGDKLYVAGGRTSDLPIPQDKPVLAVDIYDFSTAQWFTGADIPTPRGGAANAVAENEIIVAGGEINTQASAVSRVEAYNTVTDTWRQLADMEKGVHGASAAVLGNRFHVSAGSGIRGGENTSTHESVLITGGAKVDSDGDGLADEDEVQIYGTDLNSADSDEDDLPDGREVELNTDPLIADSDGDGLLDGEEVDRYGTEPLNSDTDGDGLTDGEEVTSYGTDPLKSDTDGDELSDQQEIEIYSTNPSNSDTDGDGIGDGDEVIAGTDPKMADDAETKETTDVESSIAPETNIPNSSEMLTTDTTATTDTDNDNNTGTNTATVSSSASSSSGGALSSVFTLLLLMIWLVRARCALKIPDVFGMPDRQVN